MSWLDQSAIRSSIGAEGGATLRFFGPPIHFLGGSHRFYPLKERRKATVRRPSSPRVSTCRTEDVASQGWGWWPSEMCVCRAALQGRGDPGCGAPRSTFAQLQSLTWCWQVKTREGIHSIIQHPVRWAFSAAAAAQIMCVLLPHLETTLPFSPAVHCQVATTVLHLSAQRKN